MPVWNRESAQHLLSRTLFGYTRKNLEVALSYPSAEAFVEKELLADTPMAAPPGDWVNETPVSNDPNTGTRTRELRNWWYGQMLSEQTCMRERMVLWLHNHFTSQQSKVNYPQYLYLQNKLFRSNAFGNLRQLTKDITIDPAMLIYLDGRNSSKSGPNENYARELMELFTLGIGNYTETDIKQAAKALTGWRVNGLKAEFDSTRFDTNSKTFLGKTGKWTHTDIVDIIFQQPACAKFLSEKLYKAFVFYKPDAVFVEKLARIMRENDFTLRPVLKYLFTSDEFYRKDVQGARIKDPAETLIGTLKLLDVSSLATADWNYIVDTGKNLQQQLFEPPDVAGWAGQREWISSNTYPQRGGYTDALINGKKLNGQSLSYKFKALDYARSFNSAENAPNFVNDIVNLFIRFPLSDAKKQQLLNTLLDGTVVTNWSTNTAMADVRIQKFLKAVMRLPEYQLS